MATITFHGAAQEVTGSCHLLDSPALGRVLLDCGVRQGGDALGRIQDEGFPFEPGSIDAVILSHVPAAACYQHGRPPFQPALPQGTSGQRTGGQLERGTAGIAHQHAVVTEGPAHLLTTPRRQGRPAQGPTETR